jgi:hypothetical protein
MENVLEVFELEAESVMFIKIKGFVNENKGYEENEKWCLMMDYLLYSLSLIH